MYVSAAILLAFLAYLFGYRHGLAAARAQPNQSGKVVDLVHVLDVRVPLASGPAREAPTCSDWSDDERTVVGLPTNQIPPVRQGPKPGGAPVRQPTRKRLRYAP